jgi:division protein CdvB (Snf7/Vps24/ESCRT-III family)
VTGYLEEIREFIGFVTGRREVYAVSEALRDLMSEVLEEEFLF